MASQTSDPTVFIVDDDPNICSLLRRLLESVNLRTKDFVLPQDFLNFIQPDMSGCLLLDVCMPGIGGLKLQNELIARKIGLPVIFVSGYADIPLAVDAIKKGAFDFIEKPFRKSVIIDTVQNALAQDEKVRAEMSRREAVKVSLSQLTDREREIISMIMEGIPNKGIAAHLDLSQKTIEVHRARLMAKLGVDSIAKLVKAVVTAENDN